MSTFRENLPDRFRPSSQRSGVLCDTCGGLHPTEDCRRGGQRARKGGRYAKPVRAGRPVVALKAPGTCSYCGGRHLTADCRDAFDGIEAVGEIFYPVLGEESVPAPRSERPEPSRVFVVPPGMSGPEFILWRAAHKAEARRIGRVEVGDQSARIDSLEFGAAKIRSSIRRQAIGSSAAASAARSRRAAHAGSSAYNSNRRIAEHFGT